MKASPVAISLLSFVSSASASCYPDNNPPGWGDKQRALQTVTEVCKQVRQGAGQTALAGTYEAQTILGKTANEKINDNLKYVFAIRWSGKQSTFLSESQCIEYLQREVQLCEFGGASDYDDWSIAAYPAGGSLSLSG
ncbi:hypothetical protein ACKAV7_014692 [Fusarium commune]